MNNQTEKLQLIFAAKELVESLSNIALPDHKLSHSEWELTERLQVLLAILHSL
jgi:uncharacterized tellurite resistance protein B-like protein